MMYDKAFHSHEVVGFMMEERDVGHYLVTVNANYTNSFGDQVKFSVQFV